MKHDKQWYVEKHRVMWNWIADEIERCNKQLDICKLKARWCEERGLKPLAWCFACEYDNSHFDGICKKCLFNWGEGCEFIPCGDGYYEDCYNAKTWQEQAELARLIASLPVREEV